MRSFIFFFIGLIAMIVSYVWATFDDQSVSRMLWPKVDAVIVSKEVETEKHPLNRPDMHWPHVRVRYQLNNEWVEVEIKNLYFQGDIFDLDGMNKLINEFPDRGTVSLRQNPDDPKYLIRPRFRVTWIVPFAAALFGMACLCFGVWSLFTKSEE